MKEHHPPPRQVVYEGPSGGAREKTRPQPAKTAAHKFVYSRQSVFVLKIASFFWPILGPPRTHDFNRNGLFVRKQWNMLARLFHSGAFLATFPQSPGRTSSSDGQTRARILRYALPEYQTNRGGAQFSAAGLPRPPQSEHVSSITRSYSIAVMQREPAREAILLVFITMLLLIVCTRFGTLLCYGLCVSPSHQGLRAASAISTSRYPLYIPEMHFESR
jgi:hypothetical protein